MNRGNSSSFEQHDIICPPVPRGLVDYLEKVFPDRLPTDRNINERELGALFGRQDVIVHLLSRLREQEETVLV